MEPFLHKLLHLVEMSVQIIRFHIKLSHTNANFCTNCS